MSFREKSAWACLFTTVGVYIPYFVYMFVLYERGEFRIGAVFGAFVGAVVVQTILGVAVHVVFALQSRQETKDERDLAIESRSIKVSYFLLISSGFMAVSLFTFGSTRAFAQELLATTLMSQILLLCLVVAESTRYLVQALGYRRGS